MTAIARRTWLRSLLPAAVAYVVIGVATTYLAGAAGPGQGRSAWRLAAWLLALAVFASHVGYERLRLGSSTASTAGRAAAAVALAALVLAAVGPVRSHWGAEHFWRVAALSVALWPILTGIAAFLTALVCGWILGRVSERPARAT